MADRRPNVEPTPVILNQVKKVERHDVCSGQDQEEESKRGQVEGSRQGTERGGEEQEGYEDLEDQEGAHGERIENGYETKNCFEGKGTDAGDVSRAEKGDVEEEEEENGSSDVAASEFPGVRRAVVGVRFVVSS